MSANLTKKEIIRNTTAIKLLVRSTLRVHSDYISIKFRYNSLLYYRVIIFAARGTKKTNSVMRNKLKRIGREIFRQSKQKLCMPSGDIAISLSKSILEIPARQRIYMFINLIHQMREKIAPHG